MEGFDLRGEMIGLHFYLSGCCVDNRLTGNKDRIGRPVRRMLLLTLAEGSGQDSVGKGLFLGGREVTFKLRPEVSWLLAQKSEA